MKKISTKSILSNAFVIVILLLSFIKPAYFLTIPILGKIYNVMQLLSSVVIVVMYIINGKISKFIIGLGIFYTIKLLSTMYYNMSYLFSDATMALSIIAVVMLTEMEIRINVKKFLKVLAVLLSVLMIINFVLFLIFPDGLYQSSTKRGEIYYRGNFLGIDNALTYIGILTATVVMLYSLYVHNKLTLLTKIVICIVALTLILVWSATGILSIAILILLYMLSNSSIKPLSNLVTFNKLSIFYIIIFMFLITGTISMFDFLIEDILDKSITFSNRTYLWEIAIDMIKESPILGYGAMQDGRYIRYGNYTYSAHNFILQNMLETGIIGTVILIYVIAKSGKKIQRNRNEKMAKILCIGIFSIYIFFLTEAYSIKYLMILLVFANNIDKLIQTRESKNKDLEAINE